MNSSTSYQSFLNVNAAPGVVSTFWFQDFVSKLVIVSKSSIKRETGEREIPQGVRHCAFGTAHGRHVPSQCPKQRKSPPGNIKNGY